MTRGDIAHVIYPSNHPSYPGYPPVHLRTRLTVLRVEKLVPNRHSTKEQAREALDLGSCSKRKIKHGDRFIDHWYSVGWPPIGWFQIRLRFGPSLFFSLTPSSSKGLLHIAQFATVLVHEGCTFPDTLKAVRNVKLD